MRRIIVLIMLVIVPLQFSWVAVAGLYGHVGGTSAVEGSRVHSHDAHAGHVNSEHTFCDPGNQKHGEDGQHNHCHPVFTPVLMVTSLPLDVVSSGGKIQYPAVTFSSRIPPLLDRPPLAHA